MKEAENLQTTETQALNIPVGKRKYWYATDVYTCVLCGIEKRYKERVYNESEKTTKYIEEACGEHFM